MDPGPSGVPAELVRAMLWGHGRALRTLGWAGGHQDPCRAVSSPGCISLSCLNLLHLLLVLLLLQQAPADGSSWKPIWGLQHKDPPKPPSLTRGPAPRKAAWRGLREALVWKARVGLLDVSGDRRRRFRQLNKEPATKKQILLSVSPLRSGASHLVSKGSDGWVKGL